MIEAVEKQKLVKTSYSADDVVVLLKDLTNEMEELPTERREALIQSGVHYSEMLPQEKAPSKEYEALYEKALHDKSGEIALGIARVSEIILKERPDTEKPPIIVSLARAGIPVGILIKRYLLLKYNINCPHYAISIIRDRGIDINAMEFIHNQIKSDKNSVGNICFVDGWTGKGAIKTQLEEAVAELKCVSDKWKELSDKLFVLADPANITPYCGTHVDYLLPSACLNSTVSGLTSRTILNSKVNIEAGDFHGAVYFDKFEDIDKSNEFLDVITDELIKLDNVSNELCTLEDGWNGMDIVNKLCELYGIPDYKKVKPGIGETTRVLLRRVPWKVIININVDNNDPDIQHILELCKEKKVDITISELGQYKVCGVIKELSADA